MQNNIIGSMATFPGRAHILEQVITHLAPQFSCLYIYLNNYDDIPPFLARFTNVVPVLGKEAFGDISANGKMYFLTQESDGIAFTLDDDFIYPSDYVDKFLYNFDLFPCNACLCVHGSLFINNPLYYYERILTYSSNKESKYNNIINIIGSGTAAFHISLYKDVKYNFNGNVFVDLNIALQALYKKIPIVSIARSENWLTPIRVPGLWEENKKKITHHTHILHKNINYFQWDYLRSIWYELFKHEHISFEQAAWKFSLSPASMDLLSGRPVLSEQSFVTQLKNLIEFTDNLASQE